MENAAARGDSSLPAPFGSLANPIAMMEQEHDVAAQYLDELRDLMYGYDLPANAPQA
jgi:iron-sulfur cluster repair protein YtfE (RIC family)